MAVVIVVVVVTASGLAALFGWTLLKRPSWWVAGSFLYTVGVVGFGLSSLFVSDAERADPSWGYLSIGLFWVGALGCRAMARVSNRSNPDAPQSLLEHHVDQIHRVMTAWRPRHHKTLSGQQLERARTALRDPRGSNRRIAMQVAAFYSVRELLPELQSIATDHSVGPDTRQAADRAIATITTAHVDEG